MKQGEEGNNSNDYIHNQNEDIGSFYTEEEGKQIITK